VLDGFGTTVLTSFTTPAGSTLSGITFDNVNLIITDDVNDVVIVLEGISGVEQYRFPIATGASDFLDITVTDGQFLGSDLAGNDIYVYDHPVTFDHSSPTWEMVENTGVSSSSDRGGSQFSVFENGGSPVTLPTLTQNIWADVSDSGVGIFYGPFSAMEKCRLFDETTGELIWTGSRDRGRTVSAQFTITRTDGGAADKFYQISIEVRGVVQKDSISTGVLPTTGTILTLTSLPITRDLVDLDRAVVKIRTLSTPVANTEVYACKLSIT